MARDAFHQAVRTALIKEGWHIFADPLYLKYGRDGLQIDLAANRLIVAEREQEKIAVEVKSFTNPSDVNEFHAVLGQYLNYRLALKRFEPERKLYLAIPEDAFERFFSRELARDAVREYGLNLAVYSVKDEVIVKWLLS
jgi:hypothetical protein